MEQTDNSNKIKNDYTPELIGGVPSEHQIIKEFSFLWNLVLDGYGVPMQLRRFLFAIWMFSKDGKSVSLSDSRIAEQLHGTSKNYVVKIRKAYKEWLNSDREGLRNYPFVSIKENSFDRKTKKQLPTEYLFSIEFVDLLSHLSAQVRKNQYYKTNWIHAIKDTCSKEKKDRLTEFGFWDVRKRKRERSADNILGTYLLNFKRLTGKILEFVRFQGFEAAQAKETINQLLPQFIEQAFNELNLKEASLNVQGVKIEPNKNDYDNFIALALGYVAKKEEITPTVFPKSYSENSSLGEFTNVRSSTQQSITDESGRRSDLQSSLDQMAESGNALQNSGETPIKTTLDNTRERFLQRHKNRIGDVSSDPES